MAVTKTDNELHNLKAQLQATQDKFSVWNDSLVADMREWFKIFSSSIAKKEVHLAELKEALNQLREQNQLNQQATAEGLGVIEKARKHLATLELEVNAKMAEKEVHEVTLQTETEAYQSEMEALAATEIALHTRTGELNKTSIYTRDRLGLSFQKVPGRKIQVVFRKIDPNNADEPFVLSVAVNDGKYEFSDCQPPINDLDDLVEKLNDTNNFRSFLLAVRSRFVNMI